MVVLYTQGSDAKVPRRLWNFPEIIERGVPAGVKHRRRSGVMVILGGTSLWNDSLTLPSSRTLTIEG